MTVQFIEIAGQKMAVLPVADYERLADMAEDRADAAAVANADRRREAAEEYMPMTLVDRVMSGESALKVWREYRSLSLKSLGEAAGLHQTTVSKIELGHRRGSPAMWRALADALGVSVDDILPTV